MSKHTEILALAREHDQSIAKRVRGWAVEVHEGTEVLMSYWYDRNRDVSAKAVYIDQPGDGQLALIAAHMNERINTGPLTVDALRDLHLKGVKGAGSRKIAAEVVMKPSAGLN